MGLAHGIHGWVDVAVPDMGAGRDFYMGLFGWHASRGEGSGAMPYTMFTLEGKIVAGMGRLGPEEAAVPKAAGWNTYVIVDELDEVWTTAVAIGAKPLMEPTPILDAGRMAFVRDPVGAAVGFWEAGTHGGSQIFDVPGTVTWNELRCRDVEAAGRFYGELLGWEATAADVGDDATHWTFTDAGTVSSGMRDVSQSMSGDVPALWLTWFRVDDCVAAAARVVELGGSIEPGPTGTGMGVMAVVSDPFGGVFALIETDQGDGQPPR